jgi:hypothetical protein
MWAPVGRKIQSSELGLIEPEEILFEFGGEPLTFVARDPSGDLLLAHSLCVFDRTSRYLVSAVDERILGDLKSGRLELRSALRQPRCWVVDVQEDAAVRALWQVDFDSVPQDVLPRPGTMLTPELESLGLGNAGSSS